MNSITWGKWSDPIAPLVSGKPYRREAEEDEDDPGYRKAAASFGKLQKPYPVTQGRQMVGVVAPFGIVPLHESNIPSSLFKFWVGDTDFEITPRIESAIERVPGVEGLDVFTRYRFRLAVGRAFEDEKVKAAVEAAVKVPDQPEKSKPAGKDPMEATMSARYKAWAVYVTADGKRRYVGGATKEEVLEKGKVFDGQAEKVIKSWE